MSIELSIVMPCLNEAETIESCIKKAFNFLTRNNISGEVIIGDNGSVDGSQKIAMGLGAEVIDVSVKGYGSATRAAIGNANGKYIITADTDDSHDLENLMPFVDLLRSGYQFVIGNRFKGDKLDNAMPFLHRYIGNPVLTFIGNLFFRTNVGDFHCGLRGFTKEAYDRMELKTTGMEFASEIVVKASMLNLKTIEVPTTVFPSGRTRKAHLRTFPDGWRHLRFLLLYSPKWLFLIPGLICMAIGLFFTIYIMGNSHNHYFVWLPCATSLFLISFQFVLFFALTKIYATNHNLIPRGKNYNKLFKYFTLEKGLFVGLLMFVVGITFMFLSFNFCQETSNILKITIPSSIIIAMGIQLMLFSFFFSILGLGDTET
ncbi:glycosyltransferase family 2 protein [Flavivirga sp. 57AJ16]|uniref:glycosyltransferase family 2 protein n=1 Tax=Flavivirga sp. 57AJ16 TaxID=3025307 RepID=UPI002366397C|nr:glycosyltransferase family 2 protein [Flavivirga sp. 57AJ16]MDD7885330.1 glycosyltransferase family 2 protein [Flavivirga sp. 57AJ16]